MANLPVRATFTVGDTLADYQSTIKDPSNSNTAIDVTGYTVKLYAYAVRDAAAVAAITGALTTPASGVVTFDCATIVAAGADGYRCQIELTDGSAKIQRTQDFLLVVKAKVEG
jgi:hypothetical protein